MAVSELVHDDEAAPALATERPPVFDAQVAHALVSLMTPAQLRQATERWWNNLPELEASDELAGS
jgi:hypothetical protein